MRICPTRYFLVKIYCHYVCTIDVYVSVIVRYEWIYFRHWKKTNSYYFCWLIYKDILVMRHLKLYLIPDKIISYLMTRLELRTELLKRLMEFIATNVNLARRY
jgi:hypothetical protein